MQDSNSDLRCTFTDAERSHLRDGIRMSTRDKIAFFEEMILIASQSGALAREDKRRVAQTTGHTAQETRDD